MKALQGLGGPLYDGSVLLSRRASAWVSKPRYRDVPDDAPEGTQPEQDKRAPLKRLAGLGAAGYVVVSSDYTTYAIAGGALAWAVAAFMVAGSGSAEGTEPSAEERPKGAVPAVSGVLLADAVRTVAAGGHGAHYEALAEHLTQTTGQPWDTAAVRAACRAAGIPHCGSVRQPGRSVSTGVRLADLPAPSPSPSTTPTVAVVVAGQDTPTAPTTGAATPVELQLTVEEGAGMTIIRDPSERRQYKV